MTNLIVTCGTLGMGGAERVLSTLSSYFSDNFDKVSYITWRESSIAYNIDDRVEIISLPSVSGKKDFIGKALWLRRYVRKENPSIILSFLSLFNMMTLISLVGLRYKIIVAERNDPKFIKGGRIMESIRNILYRRSSGILCQTKPIQNYFKGSLSRKTHVIYNPLFIKDEMKGICLNIAKSKRVVSVGRLHPQKNHHLMIDSFKKFLKTHPEYTLTIYGEGSERENIENYIAKNGLTNKIFLPGNSSNVHEQIKDADIFLLTSLYEGMSNALIEAMVMGIPCVSTKVSGATDLIENQKNGILCNPDTDSICHGLCQIADNGAFARLLAHESVRISDVLAQEKISEQWIEYLKSKI